MIIPGFLKLSYPQVGLAIFLDYVIKQSIYGEVQEFCKIFINVFNMIKSGKIVKFIRISNCCCCSVAKSCPSLWDFIHYSLPGFSIHGISQTRILEWVAIPYSRESSPPQGSNPGLLYYRQILYDLSQQESPGFMFQQRHL